MTNAGIKAVLKKARLEDQKLTTDWLKFYLNVYLYIVLVMTGLVIPNALSELYEIPIWIGEGNVLELLSFFLNAFAAVAVIFTFIELRDFTPLGYKWNIVFLVSSFAEYSLTTLSKWLEGEPDGRMRLSFLIFGNILYLLAWLIPNLIYFKKRKHLFRTYTTAEVAAAIKGEPPAPVLPIRKPCRYKPTKAKVDVRKLCAPHGKATRLAQIMRQQEQIRRMHKM